VTVAQRLQQQGPGLAAARRPAVDRDIGLGFQEGPLRLRLRTNDQLFLAGVDVFI